MIDNLIREDNVGVLRGAAKRAAAASRNLRHNSVREHVDAQRGGCCHDDASRYRNTSATPFIIVVNGNGSSGGGKVLPSNGSRCDIFSRSWWNEHTDRNRCESHTCRNVEKLFP